MIFKNRQQAGHLLAQKLISYENDPTVIVLGLPRGGIPVAYEIAKALNAPLDALLVRKIGVPGEEELAMGAITIGGSLYLNKDVVYQFDITDQEIQDAVTRELRILDVRNTLYRQGREQPDVDQKKVILVDDGLATGATMHAAINILRPMHYQKIIVAVPVAPAITCEEIAVDVDQLICLYTPDYFYGVGAWYQDFTQVSDEEVSHLLEAVKH